MLSDTGARVRLLGTTVVLVLVLVGSVWGDDDHWPFGPFRMYSTTTRLDGRVIVPSFRGVTTQGRTLELRTDDVGLRRAEVLGQLDRLQTRPDLLRLLAVAHARLHPESPHLRSLSLVAGVHRLEGGRPVDFEERVLATWPSTRKAQ